MQKAEFGLPDIFEGHAFVLQQYKCDDEWELDDGHSNGEKKPVEKVEIDIMPEEKKYRRKALTDEDIKRRGGDIRETLKKFMASKSKKLGRDKIDGIDVEGIEVYDPNLCTASFTVDSLVAQLWVDIETYLPVLLKAEINGAKGEKAILKADKFQWNVELDSSIFEPNIPSDYEEMK